MGCRRLAGRPLGMACQELGARVPSLLCQEQGQAGGWVPEAHANEATRDRSQHEHPAARLP